MDLHQNIPLNLISQLDSLKAELSSLDDASRARRTALRLSRQLVAALEQPEDAAVELAFFPVAVVAARIAIQLDLFNLLSNSTTPLHSRELAKLSAGEELLIVRVLRPLAAMGFVKEVAEQTWVATPITAAMAMDGIAAGHRMVGGIIVEAASQAPGYFKEAGLRCPTEPRDGFVQYAFRTKLTTYELIQSKPDVFKDFNLFMRNVMGARQLWVNWFPVQERILDGSTDESALIIDVGGGRGHDLIAFRESYPHSGRLILQDLPPVIDEIRGFNPTIETMGYDYFTDQPVKGARVYFLHHILHNWPDVKCLEILKKLREAMKPGYSKLLIHEMIIPGQGAPLVHSLFDIAMLAFSAGMERSERQWEELLSGAGLKVVKFWTAPREDEDGIVEVIREY